MAKIDWSDPEQVRAYRKAYRKANKELMAERDKKNYEKNKKRYAELNKKWHENNKERRAASQKAYREANKERLAVAAKIWREENKEHVRSKRAQWQEINKANRASCERMRRARDPDKFRTPDVRAELKKRHGITNPPEELVNLIVANRKLKRAIREISK